MLRQLLVLTQPPVVRVALLRVRTRLVRYHRAQRTRLRILDLPERVVDREPRRTCPGLVRRDEDVAVDAAK
ncbi:hypothetical protein DZF92_03715 [Clavibacter michiganensis subsp. insidiosus]|uniref:Uncharacterized protein n=1 Tax=Clavibacter michiganensis subsp. insidiosus TaxID=33014 RepID=A0A399N2D0_9MICO|nr:hypothetical protein B5P21_11285 [Clavibacter michiganensis subsp. insidiosus]RII88275.1 hypothetical protein DZF92_03715 [Clavibacter michiganensis subsp. insidiosus]RIJ44883.1 hypothetical protein DZF93_01135 [Clavibacter michiganensis subsp. insidiosus]RMC84944.1 hypothetical protein CmiCFBP2404_10020 [Clavibacter michiganensis subsp. insidiosus]